MKGLIKKQKENTGSITVEASISLVMFLLVMVFFLSFIKVARAQTKIQNAIDKAALEISQDMYIYQALGLYDFDIRMREKGANSSEVVKDVVTSADKGLLGIETLFSSVKDVSEDVVHNGLDQGNVKAAYEAINSGKNTFSETYTQMQSSFSTVKDDPVGFAKGLLAAGVSYGMDKAKSFMVGSILAKSKTQKYLGAYLPEGESKSVSGDDAKKIANALLEKLGVVNGVDGLDFRYSSVFSADAPTDINIVVIYEIKVFDFLGPFKLKMAQSASTQAWLGGDMTIDIAKKRASLIDVDPTPTMPPPTPTPSPTPTPIPLEENPGGAEEPENPEEKEKTQTEKKREAAKQLAKGLIKLDGILSKSYWDATYGGICAYNPLTGQDEYFDDVFMDFYNSTHNGSYVFYEIDQNGVVTGATIISDLFDAAYADSMLQANTVAKKQEIASDYQKDIADKTYKSLVEEGKQFVLGDKFGNKIEITMPPHSNIKITHYVYISEESMDYESYLVNGLQSEMKTQGNVMVVPMSP